MPVWRIILGFLMLSSLVASLGVQDREKNDANKEEKQNITAQYFYKFPPHVQGVLTDSIVGIEISFQSVENNTVKTKIKSATGFLVGENVVLTSLHTFSDMPAIWPHALVRIYDGRNFFGIRVVSANPSVDLALILVVEEENGAKFSKKPITFADFADKQKMPDHFFSFAFSTVGKDVYFPIELGRYLMETNLVGSEIFPKPLGIVGGNIESGFSGAPLIGPDGRVYGVLSRGGDAYALCIHSGAGCRFPERKPSKDKRGGGERGTKMTREAFDLLLQDTFSGKFAQLLDKEDFRAKM